MCDPISATTAMYAMIAATVLTAAGTAVQADAQSKAGAYQAQVAANQAKMVQDAALVEEQRKREETAQTIAMQRAKYAANGIDANFGSALEVQVSTQIVGEMDALTIRTNAANEAAGLRSQGAASKALGKAQAYSTALSGAGQIAGQWASYGRTASPAGGNTTLGGGK